jgi:hypothetical protein
VVWGPTAGYYHKKYLGETFQIVPVAGPGLQWQVAIGVKRGNEELKTRLERELEPLAPAITRLAEKYGFPLEPPRNLGQLTSENPERLTSCRSFSIWADQPFQW